MRFTANQYDQAIANLQLAKQQLEPDGFECTVCGDSGHMAFECGHNPLVAMTICYGLAKDACSLLDMFNYLAGFTTMYGIQQGPAKVVMPPDEEIKHA